MHAAAINGNTIPRAESNGKNCIKQEEIVNLNNSVRFCVWHFFFRFRKQYSYILNINFQEDVCKLKK